VAAPGGAEEQGAPDRKSVMSMFFNYLILVTFETWDEEIVFCEIKMKRMKRLCREMYCCDFLL
jgi:hypothetical protein